MSDRPWMPLDIEDYMADTAHLSAAEHGAYMLLIMRYWKDGGLPTDERLIQRYSLMNVEQWAESRDIIAAFFEDGWRHKRIDEELEKAASIIEKRRSAASARHKHSNRIASAEHVQSKSSDTGVPPVTTDQPSSLRSDGDRARKPNAIVVLQAEVDAMTAQRWAAHCEDKGKRLSIPQAEQQCGVLREIRAAGGNPAEALRFAIDKGWASLQMEYFRNNGFTLRAPPPPDEDWPARLAAFRDNGTWGGGWGPKPGEPGCKVPPELMKAAA